ncbi:DUF5110 domain-containing protein [Nonomuraea typhae]|uniref:DUF5110 domain-containing protein n=1 Tax=Nonomuraea typhae TaxID=2603600 RepID=UPI0031B5D59C
MNRALVVEYPQDEGTWQVKDQFLAGRDFLVAPVYTAGEVRDGIYLPPGRWVDYWSGRAYDGPRTLNGYHAPLERLPLFVRAGAIVPMARAGINNHREIRPEDPLTLDVYPLGESSFSLYADDGRTRAFAAGESGRQEFTVRAPGRGVGTIAVTIGPITGSYAGKPAARPYELDVHTGRAPALVLYGGRPLAKVGKAEYEAGKNGWYADGTLAHVRIPPVAASAGARVELVGAGVVGGLFPRDGDAEVTAQVPPLLSPGGRVEVPVTFTNRTGVPVRDVSLGVGVPGGWPEPAPAAARIVGDGESVTRAVTVTVPQGATAGTVTLIASAAYTARGGERTVTGARAATVPHGSPAAAFGNVGISDDGDTAKGNLDGGGSSFSRQRLAAAGLTPGAAVTAQGVAFTWPDTAPGRPDNVAAAGQTIAVRGQGGVLAFLGTGTSGSAAGPLTVHYEDGTSGQASLGFANWCCLDPTAYGSKVAFSHKGKNTASGPNQFPSVDYRVFYQQATINPNKRVIAVTLPDNAAVHVFAVTVAPGASR